MGKKMEDIRQYRINNGAHYNFDEAYIRFFDFMSSSRIINVSSTNLEQSKLCVNSPLYIDTRLLWEQTIGSNSP